METALFPTLNFEKIEYENGSIVFYSAPNLPHILQDWPHGGFGAKQNFTIRKIRPHHCEHNIMGMASRQ